MSAWRVAMLAEKYGRLTLTLDEVAAEVGLSAASILKRRVQGYGFEWLIEVGGRLVADVEDVQGFIDWRAAGVKSQREVAPLPTVEAIEASGTPYRRRSGVYFLIRTGKVVYVGQSVNVDGRIPQHTDKTFDAVHVIECEPDRLLPLEAFYIDKIRPPLNQRAGRGAMPCS